MFKFKVWDKKSNSFWKTEDGLYFYKGLPTLDVCVSYFMATPQRFTVYQYTGIKDKNNKEVYSGDRVRIKDFFPKSEPSNLEATIYFINGSFQCVNDEGKIVRTLSVYHNPLEAFQSLEVIS